MEKPSERDYRSGIVEDLSFEKMAELRECLELLLAIEIMEYHNKNWLAEFATKSNKALNEEKRHLIERAMILVGTTARRRHT